MYTQGKWEACFPVIGCVKVWAGDTKVADVFPYKPDEEGQANALLIAAAPDLQKALGDILNHCSNLGELRTPAEAAMAKSIKPKPNPPHRPG